MGQAASAERLSSGGGGGASGNSSLGGSGLQVKRRIELLEELCTASEPARRAQVLQLLSAGQNASSYPDASTRILPSAPPEFRPGRLIAAGCAGRVYAGTYCDQPAALKVLILDEDTAHEILNEVRLCLKLQHRNLVQLLDCAVVATSRHDAASQMPGSPGAAISQHSILPLFGGGSSSSDAAPSSAQWPYSYLPVVPGGQLQRSSSASPGPAAPAAGASSSSTSGAWPSPSAAALHAAVQQHEPGGARVPSSFSQACFEVWIAMELCDGGTLSEQLQQGFHCHPGSESVDMLALLPVALDVARALCYMHREAVCHGDLKADNVLLKTVLPDTSCSSCSQDECSWLGMLCSFSGSNTTASRSRRCSTESTCWSCATKGFDSCSYSDSESSSSSSNASSTRVELREQRRHSGRPGGGGSLKGHLLSGLCCISPASSCIVNDDGEVSPRSSSPCAPPGCFSSCAGCGVMTLEPSERATSSSAGHQQQRQEGQATAHVDAVHEEDQRQQGVLPPSHPTYVPYGGSPAAAAAASVPHPQLQPLLACSPHDEGAQQQGACGTTAAPQPHSPAAEEGTAEIEAVAPLSLYTQARQRRRSRCLPHSVLLPAALAAAAAAAAAAATSSGGAEHACSTSASASPDSSDDDGSAFGQRPPAQRSQGLARGSGSPSGAAIKPAAAPAGAAAPPAPGDQEGDAQHGDLAADHEVYALSAAMPVRSRARRHSYCYGSSSSYASLLAAAQPGGAASAAGSSRLQLVGGSISAAEAATAIAAAAEAVRADSLRAAAAAASAGGEPGSRARRSRRMSWDDRMLQQQSPASGALSSLLNAALPGLARTNSDATPPADERRRRARRHSWAGYLQATEAPSAAAMAVSISSSQMTWQQQEQHQQLLQHGTGSSSDTAACGPRAAQGGGGRRRARRHSWTCTEAASPAGPGQALSKLVSLRALSSCFAADTDGLRQQHLLGSLAACCWREGGMDDAAAGSAQGHSMREALLGGAQPGSTSAGLQRTTSERLAPPDDSDAGSAVGCFGRWCGSNAASSTASSVGGVSSAGGSARRPPRGRGRRYSWCCGARHDAELWADLEAERGGSSIHLALLSAGSPLSVALPLDTLPRASRRPGRDRRCSWDEVGASYQRSLVIGRKASSLDARVHTPDSWRSSAAGSSNALAGLLRAGSNGEAASAVAAACSSAFGVAEVQQIHASHGEECDVCSSRRSSLDSGCNAASDSSNGVCRELVGRTGAKLPDWTAAAATAHARAADAVLDELQGDQGVHSQAVAQPLPLLASPQQHAACASAGAAGSSSSNTALSPSLAHAGARAAATAGDTAWGMAHHSRLGGLNAAVLPSAGGAAVVAAAQQTPVASSLAGPLPPSEPLEGSFSLLHTRGHDELLSAGCAAGSGRGRRWSTGVSAGHLLLREHYFLEASGKQLPSAGAAQLPALPGRAAEGASGTAAADGSTAPHEPRARAGIAASTQAVGTTAAHNHSALQPAGSAISSSDAAAGLSAHSTGTMSGPAACSSPNAVVNVLGMPRRPAAGTAALTQRRVSYDTATGAYQLVSALDSVQLVQALGAPAAAVMQQPLPVQQQQQHGSPDTVAVAAEVHGLLQECRLQAAAGPGAGRSLSPGTQAAQQQHYQAQMQRLLDALARKGYAGMDSGSCSVAAASAPASAAAGSCGCDATADIASSSHAGSARGTAAATPSARALLEQQQHRVQAKQQQEAQAEQQQEQRGDSELLHAVTPRPRYCAKVCDFGYSKCLRAGQSHCSTASAGTLTHQSPEVLRHGHLSPAADIYAFGIILWELLTRQRPFRGLLEGDLVVGVCDNGLRPAFPPGCPPSYVSLAQQCWADEPSQRPTAVQLVRRLNELLYEERRARLKATAGSTGGAASGAGGAAGAEAHDKQHDRQRRHSMPVQGGGRPRRRSRRFSLFLLPFSRQPAVPEDEPFEEHLGHWHHSGSTSGSHHAQQQHQPQKHGPQGRPPQCSSGAAAGAAGPRACRTCGGAIDPPVSGGSTRSPPSNSNSSHAVLHTPGPLAGASSSSNAVASAGGLLASSNAYHPRRSASLSGSAAAPAGSSAGLAVPAAGTSDSSDAAEGSEWFQSFT